MIFFQLKSLVGMGDRSHVDVSFSRTFKKVRTLVGSGLCGSSSIARPFIKDTIHLCACMSERIKGKPSEAASNTLRGSPS